MAKPKGGLSKWFKEKWVDISRPKKGGGYKACGRKTSKKGKYPKCVPAAKAARMTKAQKRSAIRRKKSSGQPRRKAEKCSNICSQEKKEWPQEEKVKSEIRD